MIGNTVLLTIAMTILVFLIGFCAVDYYLAWTNQTTFSLWCSQLYQAHLHNPQFFLMIGVIAGFIIGVIGGFVLGHLFWPIYLDK